MHRCDDVLMLADTAPRKRKIRFCFFISSRICHDLIEQERAVESKGFRRFTQICFADLKCKLCKYMIAGADERFLQGEFSVPGILMIYQQNIFAAQSTCFIVRVNAGYELTAFFFKNKRPITGERAFQHVWQMPQRRNGRDDLEG